MARIRTIKPEFFRHGGLYDAEVETGLPLRVAFAGLWTACDREGRFQWKPRELKLDALPHDNVDFARVLDALLTRGHVVKYRVDGADFGFIPSWSDHQAINNREAESTLPEPDESSIESATCTREARVNVASTTRLMQDQVEGKGKEGKGKEGGPSRTRADSPPTCPEGVSSQTWSDWLKLRKAKKAAVTQTVVDGAVAEASKAALTLDAFLRIWCLRGSQGLMAEWLKPHEIAAYRGGAPAAAAATTPEIGQRAAAATQELLARQQMTPAEQAAADAARAAFLAKTKGLKAPEPEGQPQ